ncbi:MAG: TonB-dependent receptor, partial [Proteobacteria bacterium]|nr:TonB-dependent receptor [Pseudomonadota bacterium]
MTRISKSGNDPKGIFTALATTFCSNLVSSMPTNTSRIVFVRRPSLQLLGVALPSVVWAVVGIASPSSAQQHSEPPGADKQPEGEPANAPGAAQQPSQSAAQEPAQAPGVQATPATASPAAGPAQGTEPAEQILVRGIRGSLRRATDVKRESNAIVDAIAAEDLGKFPDQNVAESLQRVAGLSIDRNGGEGRFVTVRGLGPQFNNTLLNGRTMATETYGRQFSFDLLAAELISGAEVHKAATAMLQEGGIGSTINIRTARPLDFPGFRAVARAMGLYDANSGSVTPQVSGLVTNTFLDGRLGVLLSLSHQRRKARVDRINTRNYNAGTTLNLPDGRTLTGVFAPQNYNQNVDFQQRVHTGGTAALQFDVSDTVRLTLDGLYSTFKVTSDQSHLGHWYTAEQILDAQVDQNNTLVSLTHSDKGATDYINATTNRPTQTWMLGLNGRWDASENLVLTADVSTSSAATNGGGQDRWVVIGFYNPSMYDNTVPGQLPSIFDIPQGLPMHNIPPGLPLNTVDSTRARAHHTYLTGSDVKDTVYEARLDGELRLGDVGLHTLRFGTYGYARSKSDTVYHSNNPTLSQGTGPIECLYCGYHTDIRDDLLKPFDAGNFFSDLRANIPRQWQTFDYVSYLNWLQSPEAQANYAMANPMRPPNYWNQVIMENGGFDALKQPASSTVRERVLGAYTQLDFGGDLSDMPWSGNLGLRYVYTTQRSEGERRNLEELVYADATLFQAIYGPSTPMSVPKSYGNILPSL